MVGENFEICLSEMARNALKLSSIDEENLEICISEMARKVLKLSMVGENFDHGWRKF